MKNLLLPTLASLLVGCCSQDNNFHFEKYAKDRSSPQQTAYQSTNPPAQPVKNIRYPYPTPLHKVREMNSQTDYALSDKEESIYEVHDIFRISKDAADKIDNLGDRLEEEYNIDIGTIESIDRPGAKYMLFERDNDRNKTDFCIYGRPSKSEHRNIAGLDFLMEW